VCKRCQIYLLG